MVVAGHRTIDGRLVVLTDSGWPFNFRSGAPVEGTLEGERRRGQADVVENPEEVARATRTSSRSTGTSRPGAA